MIPWQTPVMAASLWARFWDPAFPIYRNGLLAGMAIAVVCGVLSVFVVSKRMAFIGQGISHAAFGGAGLAYLVGALAAGLGGSLARDLIVAGFCVVTALVIGRLAWRGRVSEDSAIGIALVAAMALGVVFLDLRRRRVPAAGPVANLHDLLFGNLLYVTPTDVWVSWGLAAAVLGGVTLFYKELLFFAFDREGAEVFGVPASWLHYGLLVALAATI